MLRGRFGESRLLRSGTNVLKWISRMLFGETAEEHFARCPEDRLFVNREGYTFTNVPLLMKTLRETGELAKWNKILLHK